MSHRYVISRRRFSGRFGGPLNTKQLRIVTCPAEKCSPDLRTSQAAPPLDIFNPNAPKTRVGDPGPGRAPRLVRPVSSGTLRAPGPLCGRTTHTKFLFRAA